MSLNVSKFCSLLSMSKTDETYLEACHCVVSVHDYIRNYGVENINTLNEFSRFLSMLMLFQRDVKDNDILSNIVNILTSLTIYHEACLILVNESFIEFVNYIFYANFDNSLKINLILSLVNFTSCGKDLRDKVLKAFPLSEIRDYVDSCDSPDIITVLIKLTSGCCRYVLDVKEVESCYRIFRTGLVCRIQLKLEAIKYSLIGIKLLLMSNYSYVQFFTYFDKVLYYFSLDIDVYKEEICYIIGYLSYKKRLMFDTEVERLVNIILDESINDKLRTSATWALSQVLYDNNCFHENKGNTNLIHSLFSLYSKVIPITFKEELAALILVLVRSLNSDAQSSLICEYCYVFANFLLFKSDFLTNLLLDIFLSSINSSSLDKGVMNVHNILNIENIIDELESCKEITKNNKIHSKIVLLIEKLYENSNCITFK